jgi:RNA polymerase sigma factor (sigma-70 family)
MEADATTMGRSSGDDYDRIVGPFEDAMIRTVCRIVRDPSDADDAFQEACTRIWRRWRAVRRHPNPRALILRICIQCAYDVVRRRTRAKTERLADVGDRIPDAAPFPEERAAIEERRRQLLDAIAQLPRNQALAVLLRLVADLSHEEIAAALGCSQATARTHYKRGCDRLREDARMVTLKETNRGT